ncbi:MAG: ABC transporter permease [Bacteroidales bacterium]|nr:ABC transporter permease [Bacteroidales bacterium]
MNFERYIARRILNKNKANFSRPIIRLGITSVALGLAVMIISVAIVTGFQKQIREKVIGFGSHIQITNYEENSSYEPSPVSVNQPFYPSLDSLPGIKHIEVFANKAGIIKVDDQIEGVILKGIGSDFDWSFFSTRIVQGKYVTVADSITSDYVIVSKTLANKLNLHVGDPLRMYFVIADEMQPRGRKFEISGIYETGLEEFDKLYVIGDIRHIQKLNKWSSDEVGGFEVLIDDYNQIDQMGTLVNNIIGYKLNSRTIKQLQPQIFEWLSLHDLNVIVIIVIMVLVAGITMVSTLLILILEKTNMIGILKSMGAKNRSIRKIFLYNAGYITGKGLLWGNLIAMGLCFIQIKTGIFKLDQESYYVPVVPVNLELLHIVLINLGTFLLCTLILIIPTYLITKISPVKAIRFS